MKTSRMATMTGLLVLVLGLTVALAMPAWAGKGPGGPNPTPPAPTEELSQEEVSALQHMLEEEKLARDVYLTLEELWGVGIFGIIADSEQQHMSALVSLCARHGLDTSVAELEPGVFRDAAFQDLYDRLVNAGAANLVSALEVGVFAEELDIFDLRQYLESVENTAVRLVFQNLLKGSRNHLRAYYAQFTLQGGEYAPQFLSQEDFDSIIESPMERGPVDENGDPRGPGGPGRPGNPGGPGGPGCPY